MQTNSDALEVHNKILKRIMRIQVDTGKPVEDVIASISISLEDFDVLRRDPYFDHIAQPFDKPAKYRGIRMNLTQKITRVNQKWSEQRKYSNRIKRRYKKSWQTVVFPKIGNGHTFPSITDAFCQYNDTGDRIDIDYKFQFNKPINHIDIKVTI